MKMFIKLLVVSNFEYDLATQSPTYTYIKDELYNVSGIVTFDKNCVINHDGAVYYKVVTSNTNMPYTYFIDSADYDALFKG